MLSNLILLLLALIFFSLSLRVVREDHRLVIFRLGRYLGVRGPGMVFRLPVVDKTQDVNLTDSLPGWQGLSKQDLDEKVKSLVLYKPLRPA